MIPAQPFGFTRCRTPLGSRRETEFLKHGTVTLELCHCRGCASAAGAQDAWIGTSLHGIGRRQDKTLVGRSDDAKAAGPLDLDGIEQDGRVVGQAGRGCGMDSAV